MGWHIVARFQYELTSPFGDFPIKVRLLLEHVFPCGYLFDLHWVRIGSYLPVLEGIDYELRTIVLCVNRRLALKSMVCCVRNCASIS